MDRGSTAKALSSLEAEREKINAAITALRALLDLPPENAPQQRRLALADAAEHILGMVVDGPPREGPYEGMPLMKAIETYLRAVGRPQSAPEIAAALKKAGVQSESKKFTNTVYSRLHTGWKEKGLFARSSVNGKWSLSERGRSAS